MNIVFADAVGVNVYNASYVCSSPSLWPRHETQHKLKVNRALRHDRVVSRSLAGLCSGPMRHIILNSGARSGYPE